MLMLQTIEKLAEFYPISPIVADNNSHSTWFVPTNGHLPLTLLWDEETKGLSCILALGKLHQDADASIPLQLMTLNLMMVVHSGPRFSYSRTSEMLTLIDFIPESILNTGNIYEVRDRIDALVLKSQQVRLYMENEGIKLTDNQE